MRETEPDPADAGGGRPTPPRSVKRLAPLWLAALLTFSAACQTGGPKGGAPDGITPQFRKKLLRGHRLSSPTCLEFGPDGRLYVSQLNGRIVALSIVRTEDGIYRVSRREVISALRRLPNHDDQGHRRPEVKGRLVTGLLLTGTPDRPIIYATSSDPRTESEREPWRVGFSNLDTNSGIISRLSWNGSRWEGLNLVRGLPRSRLNHATNGLLLLPDGRTLLVAQGGNTNLGGPSKWLGLLPEYALSAAILAIDLQQIGETTYDLPTLDDEDRPGKRDANDPFGGNWGKNQAILEPDGPVRIYAPGFRNPYDLLLSAKGKLYTIDNGSNAGWGGCLGSRGRKEEQPTKRSILRGIGFETSYTCSARVSTADIPIQPGPTPPIPSTRRIRSLPSRERPLENRSFALPSRTGASRHLPFPPMASLSIRPPSLAAPGGETCSQSGWRMSCTASS